MPQPNDLSRSLVPLDQDSTIIAVVEMSQSSWLVAGVLPGIERQPCKKLEPSAEGLLDLLHRWRDVAVRAGKKITRIALAFEASASPGPVSHQLLDLAGIAAVWGGAADRVGRLYADRQVDIGAVGIEHRIRADPVRGRRATSRAAPMPSANNGSPVGRIFRRPDRGSQVRDGLAGGGRGIRTLG